MTYLVDLFVVQKLFFKAQINVELIFHFNFRIRWWEIFLLFSESKIWILNLIYVINDPTSEVADLCMYLSKIFKK